jgi:hypothetical protein
MLWLSVLAVSILAFSSSASSYCSCKGEADVLRRDELQLPVPGRSDRVARDVGRDEIERPIRVDLQKTSCDGHDCCPELDAPIFVYVWWLRISEYRWDWPFNGTAAEFATLKPGARIAFTYSCSGGMTPSGAELDRTFSFAVLRSAAGATPEGL